MNKKFFGLIFAFVLVVSTILSSSIVNSASAVVLTPTNINPTSVVIKVSGAPVNSDVRIYVYTDVLETSPLYKQFVANVVSDNGGGAEASFSGLEKGVNYKAETKIYDLYYTVSFKTPKPQLNFTTLNGIIRTASDRLDNTSIVEGSSIGQYKVGSKALLSEAISHAEHVVAGVDIYNQADIDLETRSLQNALNTFELSKISSSTPPASAKASTSDTTDIEKNGIVPRCNNLADGIDATTGQYKVPCDFTFFMRLINNVIKFLLFVIATPLIALILMYTGYLYLTAGGSSGQVEKVRHILMNAVVGYVIALAAWLIVNTIVTSVIKIDPTINTFLGPMQK